MTKAAPPSPPATGREELLAIAKALQLSVDFPPAVIAEADAWVSRPEVDDPALDDFTAVPFVTIDGAHSKDLDQAVHVARTAAGYLVEYAIADAAFYVRPGSALFAEALRRGASYYFPGFSVPMLPRTLCEGVISLNPDGPRRALVFQHRLDADGQLLGTELHRARVRSRAKLSFGAVQQLVDRPEESALRGAEFEPSLRLLREVGRKRMAIAVSRGLVRYRREEVQVELDGRGLSFAVMEVVRDEVELWNEQLSLLCNAEGGRLLREHPNPAIQPIYRVHAGPDPQRLASLARLTERVAAVHALPTSPWVWNPATTALADWLAGLPRAAPLTRDDRLARALALQAVMVSLRSEYSTEPGPHVGVGAEPYARFSAPMRELVGVFLHKEAIELLTGVHPTVEEDETLRAEVVKVANRSREMQRKVQDLSNEVVLSRLFTPELALAPQARTRFRGTVTGLAGSKVYVRLDTPPLDVKLQLFDLAPFFKGAWLEVAEEGAVLRVKGTTAPLLRLGDELELAVHKRDEVNRRWLFAPRLSATLERRAGPRPG
jgi:ribonuclease R